MTKRILSFLCAASVLALSVPTDANAQRRARPPSEEQIVAYLADKPPELHAQFRTYMTEGERNAVLNLTRTGLAAMEMGADAVAASAFDQALERIEAIYADNEAATRARSNFVREATKDFKGEPYERAMTYYYRGLLYLRAGDYENARASFEGGQLQDTYAEDTTYQNDFAMLSVLSGWSSQCLGATSLAEESYNEAREALSTTGREAFAMPGPEDRVLLVADLGVGPIKTSDGQYQENLRFQPATNFTERRVLFSSPEVDGAIASAARTAQADLVAAQAAYDAAQAELAARTSVAESAEAAAVAAAAASAPPPAVVDPALAVQAAATATDAGAVEEAAPAPAPTPAAVSPELIRQAAQARASADTAAADLATAREAANAAQATLTAKQEVAQGANALVASIGLNMDALPAAAPAEGAATVDTAIAAAVVDAPSAALAPLTGQRAENLFWQASTRGGRAIDGILAGKAEFKANATQLADTTSQLSSVAIQTANSMMTQAQSMMAQGYNVDMGGANAAAGIGLGLMAFSLASRAVAAATTPQADIRYWDNLPAEVHLSFAPSGSAFRASFVDEAGASVRTVPANVVMDSQNRCGVAWVRSQPGGTLAPAAPNSAHGERRRR
ncbi:hypothetical protein U91I_02382 [alpha proteobacterium U9-1i]|nr:hypothetical protein U91I_02382 [alpha proteobacterium U9-1i]